MFFTKLMIKARSELLESRGSLTRNAMLSLYQPILREAEAAAKEGANFVTVIKILRQLPLEDFGLLLLNMPNAEFPALTNILPPMAPDKVQVDWTGSSGIDVYRQTVVFARILETNYFRFRNTDLHGKTVLDFGCGYGRITRMLYYYTDPDQIWGVDAWDRSLKLCSDSKLPGNFALSQKIPTELPVGNTKFDLLFALSVFTHLAPPSALACLSSLRKHVKDDGLLMLTIRPMEFWDLVDQSRGSQDAPKFKQQHEETGYAYRPHNGVEGETYGDCSVDPSFFNQLGWKQVGLDRSVHDPFQVTLVLKPEPAVG